MNFSTLFIVILGFIGTTVCLKPYNSGSVKNRPTDIQKSFGSIKGQKWEGFEGLDSQVLMRSELQPIEVFRHVPDDSEAEGPAFEDGYEKRKKAARDENIGKALEVLRRELPYVFAASNHDYSIFAASITVADGKNNKMVMQKPLYIAAVNSLRMASRISSIYPSMNVRKIEYIEETSTIQCLVDVVLPDTVRVDGQAVWEGMFYFGLDKHGLIDSHIMDRKVSNFTPNTMKKATAQMPWLRAAPAWSSDLLQGSPLPTPVPGFVTNIEKVKDEKESEEVEEHSIIEILKR